MTGLSSNGELSDYESGYHRLNRSDDYSYRERPRSRSPRDNGNRPRRSRSPLPYRGSRYHDADYRDNDNYGEGGLDY